MLPVEFTQEDWRFSLVDVSEDGAILTYRGAQLVGGKYVSGGELTVKASTTKPSMLRLFRMLDEISLRGEATVDPQ